jgi:hypothetical protein
VSPVDGVVDSRVGVLMSEDEVEDTTIGDVVGMGVGLGLFGRRAGGGYLAKKRISRGGSDLASCTWWELILGGLGWITRRH